jgi:anti-sigma B factor antagonist
VDDGDCGPVRGRAGPGRPPMRIATSRPGPDVCLVAPAGELDMATAPLLREHLRRETSCRPPHLVLDLTAVEFISAAGITLIVDAKRNDDGIHGRLQVVTPPGSTVLRALRLTSVHTLLDIHGTVGDALAAAQH